MEVKCPRCDEILQVDVDALEGVDTPTIECECGYKFLLKLVKPKLKVDPRMMDKTGDEAEEVPVIMEKVGRKMSTLPSPEVLEYALIIKEIADKGDVTKVARQLLSIPGETRKLKELEDLLSHKALYAVRGLSKIDIDRIEKSLKGMKVDYSILPAKDAFCEKHGKAKVQFCPNCGRGACPECSGERWVCEGCDEEVSIAEEGKIERFVKKIPDEIVEAPVSVEGEVREEDIIIATLPAIEGKRITRVMGVVSSEYIIPETLLRKLMIQWREEALPREEDMKTTEETENLMLRAFSILRKKAKKMGANAILGISFSQTFPHSDFMGKGVMVIVSGTAVKID